MPSLTLIVPFLYGRFHFLFLHYINSVTIFESQHFICLKTRRRKFILLWLYQQFIYSFLISRKNESLLRLFRETRDSLSGILEGLNRISPETQRYGNDLRDLLRAHCLKQHPPTPPPVRECWEYHNNHLNSLNIVIGGVHILEVFHIRCHCSSMIARQEAVYALDTSTMSICYTLVYYTALILYYTIDKHFPVTISYRGFSFQITGELLSVTVKPFNVNL